jgi:hypothetical protein
MTLSTDLTKLVSVGDTISLSMGKTSVTGKVIETTVLEWNRNYRVRWDNGRKDWLSQAQVRVLTVN